MSRRGDSLPFRSFLDCPEKYIAIHIFFDNRENKYIQLEIFVVFFLGYKKPSIVVDAKRASKVVGSGGSEFVSPKVVDVRGICINTDFGFCLKTIFEKSN